MKTKRIYVFLCGGLGNQMFQYATARALGLKRDAELVLDSWSGFARDFQYRRQYELNQFPVRGRVALPWERLPIWLFRAENSVKHKLVGADQPADLLDRRSYGNFLVETRESSVEELDRVTCNRSLWLVGYWQNSKYFQDHTKLLLTELMPPAPTEPKFIALGRHLRQVESVALGVRLYEEGPDPVKSVEKINGAVTRLRNQCPKATFFVFCTHRSSLLQQIKLPVDSVFITHDDGYEGTLHRLWLLAQCRHHVFNMSSYYWWGAWLSQQNYSSAVVIADEFYKQKTPDHWQII